jgi:hypothetical protein
VGGTCSGGGTAGSSGPELVFIEGVITPSGALDAAAATTPAAVGDASGKDGGSAADKDKKPVVRSLESSVPLENLSLQELKTRPLFDRVTGVATRGSLTVHFFLDHTYII